MGLALAIISMLNAATPGIASLILLIRKTDGTVSVVTLLDEADKDFAANIAQAQEWLSAHPKP